MEAYEEKSYDIAYYHGSVGLREQSVGITKNVLSESFVLDFARRFFVSCAQSSEALALRLPLKFGCNWRKIDRKGKCRKDSEST